MSCNVACSKIKTKWNILQRWNCTMHHHHNHHHCDHWSSHDDHKLPCSGARSSTRTRCARLSGSERHTTSPWASVTTMRAESSLRSDQFNHLKKKKNSWKIQREFIEIIGCNLWPFPLQGDYNQYECGLTVAKATAEDDGEWECDFESYVKVT